MIAKNRKYGLAMIAIGLILIFSSSFVSLAVTPSCGTANVTYTVKNGNTGAGIVGASVSTPEGSALTNTNGQATINGIKYGDTVQISATGYYPFSETENYCPAQGTSENTGESIFINPSSIVADGSSSTVTVTESVNSTFYSTTTYTSPTTLTSTNTITQSGTTSTQTSLITITSNQVVTSTSVKQITTTLTVAPNGKLVSSPYGSPLVFLGFVILIAGAAVYMGLLSGRKP